MAWNLTLARHCAPESLRSLDRWIGEQAEHGIYTLVLLAARLWINASRLSMLAARYAQLPHVHLALLGRKPLARRLWQAAMALQHMHPSLFLWLPLECAHAAPTHAAAASVGWLWDATTPQRPALMAVHALAYPIVLRGWCPDVQRALLINRTMALCREASIGWLARPDASVNGGSSELTAAAVDLKLRLAVHLSHVDASGNHMRATDALRTISLQE